MDKKTTTRFEFYPLDQSQKKYIPLYENTVPAGFPSPAEDFLEKELDLNEYLIRNKAATFLIRVSGESMKNAGILDGDILVVDRSLPAISGKVVLCILNGEFTVKRMKIEKDQLTLFPENEQFSPITVTDEMEFRVWGVVSFAIHKLI